MPARRPSLLVFFAVSTLALGGCLPERVAWLPDSSGFVCTSGEQNRKLVRFDLASRSTRVIFDRPTQQTVGPAVSPDGKWVALVRCEIIQEVQSVEILFLDLNGNKVQRSEVFEVDARVRQSGNPKLLASYVAWSPRGDRLLIAPLQGRIVSYDIGRKAFKAYGASFSTLDLLDGGSIPPDGGGFLAQRGDPMENLDNPYAGLIFVDWEGRVADFKVTPETTDTLKRLSRAERPTIEKLGFAPWGRWEGPVVIQPLHRGVVRVDCARRTITYAEDARTTENFDRLARDKITIEQVFANDDTVLQVQAKGKDSEGNDVNRILAWFPKEGRRMALVEDVVHAFIYPAPDGKSAAVLYDLKASRHILVVDAKGRAISDFELK